jgi:hypothetical protein
LEFFAASLIPLWFPQKYANEFGLKEKGRIIAYKKRALENENTSMKRGEVEHLFTV